MAGVGKVQIERKDMKRVTVEVMATEVRIPLRVLIPFKIGSALIRLGALIAGVTYKQE